VSFTSVERLNAKVAGKSADCTAEGVGTRFGIRASVPDKKKKKTNEQRQPQEEIGP
jgi:hypothetical protein